MSSITTKKGSITAGAAGTNIFKKFFFKKKNPSWVKKITKAEDKKKFCPSWAVATKLYGIIPKILLTRIKKKVDTTNMKYLLKYIFSLICWLKMLLKKMYNKKKSELLSARLRFKKKTKLVNPVKKKKKLFRFSIKKSVIELSTKSVRPIIFSRIKMENCSKIENCSKGLKIYSRCMNIIF